MTAPSLPKILPVLLIYGSHPPTFKQVLNIIPLGQMLRSKPNLKPSIGLTFPVSVLSLLYTLP